MISVEVCGNLVSTRGRKGKGGGVSSHPGSGQTLGALPNTKSKTSDQRVSVPEASVSDWPECAMEELMKQISVLLC